MSRRRQSYRGLPVGGWADNVAGQAKGTEVGMERGTESLAAVEAPMRRGSGHVWLGLMPSQAPWVCSVSSSQHLLSALLGVPGTSREASCEGGWLGCPRRSQPRAHLWVPEPHHAP